ncbi:hypothetical protein F4560_008188 [Saccharothrix ecbatanensis]|uniref:Uncharacterized protein n=1 Tax=Saccharothrix ecbatanensis TaxID=1105145 RepID=A0A7W9M5R9_9PSEU|nr:hypothetical protein [Saccharothrix ecbatanensis]MBB5808420.1 hypothetical protein [Saccharothrix ecbatanensis]
MKSDVGVRVRTSAEIDVSCTIEYEVVGKQAFFSFADGAICLMFTDERAFKKFMAEAMEVLATPGLGEPDATSIGG